MGAMMERYLGSMENARRVKARIVRYRVTFKGISVIEVGCEGREQALMRARTKMLAKYVTETPDEGLATPHSFRQLASVTELSPNR